MISLLFGAGLAFSQMEPPTHGCSLCDSDKQHERFVTPGLSLEARGDSFGLMASYGQNRYDSQVVAGPAYFATRPDDTIPNLHASIRQTMTAQWFALQGTYRYQIGDLALRAQAGYASVLGKNYERGYYDTGSGPYWVEHYNSTRETRPIYGLGLEYAFTPRWLGKLEWQRIDHAVVSQWTSSNKLDSVSAQVVFKF